MRVEPSALGDRAVKVRARRLGAYLKRAISCGAVAGVVAWSFPGAAAVIDLFGHGFNVDGTRGGDGPTWSPPYPSGVPAGVDMTLFDTTAGLGKVQITVTGVGQHHIAMFVDHEFDDPGATPAETNGFFNEIGTPNGTAVNSAAAKQFWEIDDPGLFFIQSDVAFLVDDHAGDPSLPNWIDWLGGSPGDVSMAMAWVVELDADETLRVDYHFDLTAPTGVFYLEHHDPDSLAAPTTLYFWSEIAILQAPEPGSLALLGIGLLGLMAARRRSRADA